MAKGRKNATLTWLETVNGYNKGYMLDLIDNLKAICEVTKEAEMKDVETFSHIALKAANSLYEGIILKFDNAIDFYKGKQNKDNLKSEENGN